MAGRSMGAYTIQWFGVDKAKKALRDIGGIGKQGAVAYVGTNLTDPPYPFFLEYGTSRMPAYPTARPAFDETKEQVNKTVQDVIVQLVGKKRTDSGLLLVAVKAGGLVIANSWKQHIQKGPVSVHNRDGKMVTNLSRTGTYAKSVHVEGELVDGVVFS